MTKYSFDFKNDPSKKLESHDGQKWFKIASETWAENNIKSLEACSHVMFDLTRKATYETAANGNRDKFIASDDGFLTIEGGPKNVDFPYGQEISQLPNSTGESVLVLTTPELTTQYGSRNGIYTIVDPGSSTTPWVLERRQDFYKSSQIRPGRTVVISKGDYAKTMMMVTQAPSSNTLSEVIDFQPFNQKFSDIKGAENELIATVVDGVVTIGFAENPIISGTGSLTIPNGTTEQRIGGVGAIRMCTVE